MRIAVVTFFQSQNNYGQILQCYALQQALRKLGHRPYLIRYGFHQQFFHWLKIKNFLTIQGLRATYHQFKGVIRHGKEASGRGFDEFRKKHLTKSLRTYNSLAELQHCPPPADCYITGSDQVWAQLLSKDDNRVFFLDFGPKRTNRLSYAASFALDDYPADLKGKLAEQLVRFDAISVRERTGVDICKSVGFDATLALDPTLLLTADDYRKLIEKPSLSHYCFVYQVNVASKEELWWDDFSDYNRKHGLSSVATFANPIYDVNMEFLDGADYIYPSIGGWLGYLSEAEYVLTSSFHGVVFSLLFHKPFVVCLRKESMFAGNDRVTTLLDALDLSDRIMSVDRRTEEIMPQPIDWGKVDSVLNQKRGDSFNFLRKNLRR